MGTDCLFPPCWAEVLAVQLSSPHDLENIVRWVLHNIFINGLEQGGNGMLIKFADDTKLGDVANIREGRALIQEDVGRLELQAGKGQVSCWTCVTKAPRT